MSDVPYILGHSPAEVRHLMLQAAILKPITERLLREAGLTPGLRVLDLGCGCGDVAMLAAELVGPNGAVVGIDRSAEVLAVARERAQAAGHANIEFRESAAEDFVDQAPFDLAIGRYVLIHQGNPAAFIRSAASHVRRGGIIAFHEIGIYGECQALPPVPLWQQTWSWARAGLRSVMVHPDAGGRMIAHFHEAGLSSRRCSAKSRSTAVQIPQSTPGWHSQCAACCHKSRRLVPPRQRRSISTPWRTACATR